jgi:hypothetical protein
MSSDHDHLTERLGLLLDEMDVGHRFDPADLAWASELNNIAARLGEMATNAELAHSLRRGRAAQRGVNTLDVEPDDL